MPPTKIYIPLKDIKGLQTLVKEGFTYKQMSEYYSQHGIYVDRRTLSRRISDMDK